MRIGTQKGYAHDSTNESSGLVGEHPFNDIGQVIFILVYLTVWITDSFVLRDTNFLGQYIPLCPVRRCICDNAAPYVFRYMAVPPWFDDHYGFVIVRLRLRVISLVLFLHGEI